MHLSQESGGGLDGVAGGSVAAGKRGRAQMRYAIKAFHDAPNKELSAPDSSIVSEARSVETYAQDPLLPCPALGENGGDVRPVVLDGVRRRARQCERMHRGEILRMS